jgi:type I restriction-modification system, R subunit
MSLKLARKKKDIIFKNGNYESYRRKVEKFFEGNLDNLTVYKIRHNQKLNETEKKELEGMFQRLGNNVEYDNTYGNMSLIEVVRSIVGIDEETANEIFAKYINDSRLNSKQIEFVRTLIRYVHKNGILSIETLKGEPFSPLGSVSEVFEDNVEVFELIKKDIESINENAKMYA